MEHHEDVRIDYLVGRKALEIENSCLLIEYELHCYLVDQFDREQGYEDVEVGVVVAADAVIDPWAVVFIFYLIGSRRKINY